MLKSCRKLHSNTRIVSSGLLQGEFRPSSTPIFQTATFEQQDCTQFSAYDYSRSGNPTRSALEHTVSSLELDQSLETKGEQVQSLAFVSGVAAVSAIMRLVGENQRILASNDLYGGTLRLFGESDRIDYVDLNDLQAVVKHLEKQNYAMIWLETPSNPLMTVYDLGKLASLLKGKETLLVVDNTMLSSYLQRPLELGADIALQSATKFISGHSDTTGGIISVLDRKLGEKLNSIRNAHGSALPPFDSWLMLRGLKTLSVRMDRQQQNANHVFEYLSNHPVLGMNAVYYPKQDHVNMKQSLGPGSVMSVRTGSSENAVRLVESLKLFKCQVSFGSISSSIEIPNFHSHASVPQHLRNQISIPDDLVRLSIGLEDHRDLLSDLEQALPNITPKSNARQTRNGTRSFSSRAFSSPSRLGKSTKCVHSGEPKIRKQVFSDTLTTPVCLSSAFHFENSQQLMDFTENRHASFEYGRYGNPTTRAVEEKLIGLESFGGETSDCLVSSSGMNSCTTMLMALVPPGGSIVTTKDCYRRTRQFISTFLPNMNISHVVLNDPSNLEEIEQVFVKEKPSLFFSESPTNPFLRCVDVRSISKLCKAHNVLLCIDSTFATPINQRPLELGADLVLHSMSKYIAGHNDVIAGALIGSKHLIDKVRNLHNVLGGVLDPFSSYLVLRGLKTLALRVEHQNKTALELAKYLELHDDIERVFYPGLDSHPDHLIARSQMSGFGGVVSFLVKGDLHRTASFIDGLSLPYIAPSLGGVESLVEQPTIISYWDQSREYRDTYGISDNLVRFSCGVESTSDVIQDFEQALESMTENHQKLYSTSL